MAEVRLGMNSAGSGIRFYPAGNGEPLKSFRQGRWRDRAHFREIFTAVWVKAERILETQEGESPVQEAVVMNQDENEASSSSSGQIETT